MGGGTADGGALVDGVVGVVVVADAVLVVDGVDAGARRTRVWNFPAHLLRDFSAAARAACRRRS